MYESVLAVAIVYSVFITAEYFLMKRKLQDVVAEYNNNTIAANDAHARRVAEMTDRQNEILVTEKSKSYGEGFSDGITNGSYSINRLLDKIADLQTERDRLVRELEAKK